MTNNQFTVKAGTLDENESKEMNLTYVSCDLTPNNVVINLKAGNESRITGKGMCYTIEVADCKVLEAVEKFEVESIVQAKTK